MENSNYATIIPNIGVPKNTAVIPIFFIKLVLARELLITISTGPENSAVPDQEQFDLGTHCLISYFYPNSLACVFYQSTTTAAKENKALISALTNHQIPVTSYNYKIFSIF